MADVFADTFYFLARLSRNDAAHTRAIEVSRNIVGRTVITAWILTEVADALQSPHQRKSAVMLFDTLRNDPSVLIVPPDSSIYDRGWDLYRRREDKAWSLTDCISFVVMDELDIRNALTGDQHFEQAGFVALLK